MPKPTRADIEKYGEVGSAIPGSKLVRGYCAECGTPIRVPELGMGRLCEVCSGEKKDLMPGGYAGPVDIDSGGYRTIALRALEG